MSEPTGDEFFIQSETVRGERALAAEGEGVMGEPEDVDGQCNAHLYLADNYGDNHATIRCQLTRGHTGKHLEVCRNKTVEIRWEVDERELSDDLHERV